MVEPTRRQRERERHRREVLEAAEVVFAEKGFHGAAVQEIAERAEFAVGSIYNMFESKTAIYEELLATRAQQYIAQVKSSIEGLPGPKQKIQAILKVKLRFFDENQPFFRMFRHVFSGGEPEPPSAMAGRCGEIYKSYLHMVDGIFAEGIQHEVFVDIPPALLTIVLEGMTNALIAHSIQTGQQELAGAARQQIERIFLGGVLREGREA